MRLPWFLLVASCGGPPPPRMEEQEVLAPFSEPTVEISPPDATHVVQHLRLGSQSASDARFRADVSRCGVFDQYNVPPELDGLSIEQLNPIDSRFALEGIAEHVKDLAYEAEGLGL